MTAIACAAVQDPLSVTGVWLDGNDIGSTGAKALAEALQQNSHLKMLSLSRTEGDADEWGDAVRVQISLPDPAARVDGKGDFDCQLHTAQVSWSVGRQRALQGVLSTLVAARY